MCHACDDAGEADFVNEISFYFHGNNAPFLLRGSDERVSFLRGMCNICISFPISLNRIKG